MNKFKIVTLNVVFLLSTSLSIASTSKICTVEEKTLISGSFPRNSKIQLQVMIDDKIYKTILADSWTLSSAKVKAEKLVKSIEKTGDCVNGNNRINRRKITNTINVCTVEVTTLERGSFPRESIDQIEILIDNKAFRTIVPSSWTYESELARVKRIVQNLENVGRCVNGDLPDES